MPAIGWTGDPVWLEDVLRPALGNRLKTLSGWRDAGHGDFADIRGVMVHHTGYAGATAESIRYGRPDLDGPLSQLHIAQDGTVTIVAVGVAWHAGAGSYSWLPVNMGNWHLIGIECAWPRDTSLGPDTAWKERWPDAEIISMRDTCAALIAKLGFGVDRVIGHKEYAGAVQGKWDPGNIDMGWFRGEVLKDIQGQFDTPPIFTPPPDPPPVLPPGAWAGILLYRGMPPNAQVRELERRLKAAYSAYAGSVVVDGNFDSVTELAVREFQRRSKLKVDGIVGPLTAAALNLKIVK